MPSADTHKPRRTFGQRLTRFIIANAVTLSIVFVLALPLSYIVGQRIVRARQLDKLTHTDPAVFEQGVDYLFLHVPHEPWARDAAVEHIDTLAPERAARVLWAVGQSYREAGLDLPDAFIDAGTRLIARAGYADKFKVYGQLAQLGVGEDPRVRGALHGVLDDPDDRRFIQAVEFYDANFLWLRDAVPADAWLRWAVLLSRGSAPQSQLRAAQLLGDMPGRINDPALPEALARLALSTNASVRGEALDAAAGYARVADDPVPYEQVLIALTEDDNETLARRAWITLGLLNPLSGFSADWRSAEPAIAEAMLWAAVKTNPRQIQPAHDALLTDAYETESLMALAEGWGRTYELVTIYENPWPGFGQVGGRDANLLAVWRSILALKPGVGDHEVWYVHANGLIELPSPDEFLDDPLDPFSAFSDPMMEVTAESLAAAWETRLQRYFAVTYRFNEVYSPSFPLTDAERQLAELAAVEGQHHAPFGNNPIWVPTSLYAQLCGAALDVFRRHDSILPERGEDGSLIFVEQYQPDLHAIAKALDLSSPATNDLFSLAITNAKSRWLNELIRSAAPAKRNSAIIAAGMLQARPTMIDNVTSEFLSEHPDLDPGDLHGYTGAQLADLGLRRVDALTTLLHIAETAPDRDDRHEQIALLKLALWMRGDLGDDFIPEAEAMLEDERLPASTVLMCLLHMQRPAALYYLFDPPAGSEQELDLYDLFVNQRWWHVFSRLVPDADLDLWLWGDPGAQAFQFEVMRQWVQANRWRLEDGWWPAPPDAAAE